MKTNKAKSAQVDQRPDPEAKKVETKRAGNCDPYAGLPRRKLFRDCTEGKVP
jgi:hypothetical protein